MSADGLVATQDSDVVVAVAFVDFRADAPEIAVASLLSGEEWVRTLTQFQLYQVLPEDVRFITAPQLQSAANADYFRAWSAESRAALQPWQVQSLNVGALGLGALTAQQIGWLTKAQVQQLTWDQFQLLPPSLIQHLTSFQLQSLTNVNYFRAWSADARAALQAAQVQSLNIDALGIGNLTTQQIGWLTAAQVKQVTWDQFQLLYSWQIPQLSIAQIQSLTSVGYFNLWSAASRTALEGAQVQSLNIGALGLGNLSVQQISWLTPGQVQQVGWRQFHLLPASQIPNVSASQLQTLTDVNYFNAWSPAARAALQPQQVQALNIGALGLGNLSVQQISWLTPGQVQQVSWRQFHLLPASQIPNLSATQLQTLTDVNYFNAWSLAARAALQPGQVQSLNIDALGIRQLTLTQTASLTLAQVRQVKWYEFQYLSPVRIPYLSTAQLKTLASENYFRSWSAAARAALQLAQVQALNIGQLGVDNLTPLQRGWLTGPQVQQITRTDLLRLLPAEKIPFLMASQVAGLNGNQLYMWSEAARAALQSWQIQALSIPSVGLMMLTPEQVSWLSGSQVQQVKWEEFELLSPLQASWLTTDQLGTLHDLGRFRNWSAEARAALTYVQVRALDVASLRLEYLTELQRSWLSTEQIQSANYRDIPYLKAFQIPLLSVEQMQAIPAGAFLFDLPESLQTAFTNEQLLSLSLEVWASYSHESLPPATYDPAQNNQVGPDGLPSGVHAVAEAEKAFALAPLGAATHATIASGNWSDPRIWSGGVVPSAGAKVVVAAGTTVTFDAYQTTAIKTLRIDGTLSFAVDLNTQLKVDTVVVYSTGKLFVGTAQRPIQDNVTARILIADNGPIDRVWDPYMLSRGIVSRGEVKMYGRSTTAYVAATTDLMMGATKISLSSPPTGWRVGDKIVITGVDEMMMNAGAEERTILAINGSVVTVAALNMNHDAPQEFGGYIHVANMTRNIEIAAEDDSVVAERPHIMFMHNANVVLSYVGVYGFGRTDKSMPINDPVVINGVLQPGTGTNPRARYSIHFHHTGVNPTKAPAEVIGSVVDGSAGWGYVNHSSNVNFENNVAYQVHGASFASEDGNEIGAMIGNLSISSLGTYGDVDSRHMNHDFAFMGHGFWFQGPGLTVENNISAGSRGAAYLYFTMSTKNLFDAANLDNPTLAGGQNAVPVGSVPLKRFFNNVAYASRTGLEIWHHMQVMNEGYGIIESFLSWNTTMMGIDVHYSGQLKIRNARLFGDVRGYMANVGVETNFLTQGISIEDSVIVGFEVGVRAPVRRTTSIQRGYVSAVTGIDVGKGEATDRSVIINGTIFNSLSTAALQGRTQRNIYLHAPYDFAPRPARRIESLYSEDVITYLPRAGGRYRLYYDEQSPSFVPFTMVNANGYVPSSYLGLTNQQLQTQLGVVLRGGTTPAIASSIAGVSGGLGAAF